MVARRWAYQHIFALAEERARSSFAWMRVHRAKLARLRRSQTVDHVRSILNARRSGGSSHQIEIARKISSR
jgi:hypothetical protein